MERIDLISSQFPSGVAWLLNFFVENNILIYRGGKIEDTWEIRNGTFKLRKDQDILKQWIPCFVEKNEFAFRNELAVRWSHEFPDKTNTKQKTILLIRDGRDCIYSQFKREEKYEKLADMLHSKVEPFGLRPAETWALHCFWWEKKILPEKLCIIKFEEIKSDPVTTINKLLNFLGIILTEEQIKKGIESSSFERAKMAEEKYQKEGGKAQFKLVNRKGTAGEWKCVYFKDDLACFEGFPNSMLKKLNYVITDKNEYSKWFFLKVSLLVVTSKIKKMCFYQINKFKSLFLKGN